MRITCDFPGGNILLSRVCGNDIYVRQDLRDTGRWWFYWNFQAVCEHDGLYAFHFGDGEVVGPLGPAVSIDGGEWRYAGRAAKTEDGFSCAMLKGCVYHFAWAIPYQLADYQKFADSLRENALFAEKTLCVSKAGRGVPLFQIGRPDAKKKMLITARHHACESTASFVLAGLARRLLSLLEIHPRSDILACFVPFVDLDGVEHGDQGKGRIPHDHYQDYSKNPIYSETRAVMDLARRCSFDFFLDLHCPYMWAFDQTLSSLRNDHPFFCREPMPVAARVDQLGEMLERATARHPYPAIRYERKYDLNAGDEWFTEREVPGASHTYFAKNGVALSTILEFSYFGAEVPHDIAAVSRFGEDLAEAVFAYEMKEGSRDEHH